MQVCFENLLLSCEDLVPQQLRFHLLKAQPVDGCCKPLSGQSLFSEQQDGLLHHGQHFLLRGEDLGQCVTLGNLLAPPAADIDLIAGLSVLDGVEVALAHAASAVVAERGVDLHDAVHDFGGAHGTYRLNGALAAAGAEVGVIAGNPLAHDAQVVQVGLDAVVGTSAHRQFELVGQLDAAIALVEQMVQLLGQVEGVDQAVLAGGALAAHHGTDLGAGAAGDQASLGNVAAEVLDLVEGDAGDLNGQAGGEDGGAVAEFLSGLGDDSHLLGGDLAVYGDDTAVEVIGALVVEKALGFHLFDLFGFQCAGHENTSMFCLLA